MTDAPALPGASRARKFLVAGFLLLVFVVLLSVWFARQERADSAAAEATLVNSQHLTDLLSTMRQAETGERAYLLTGDPRYLTTVYDYAIALIPGQLQTLRETFGTGPQAAKFAAIASSVSMKLGELSKSITMYQHGDLAGAVALMKRTINDRGIARLRDVVGALQKVQVEELARNRVEVVRAGWLLQGATLLAVLATILLALVAIRENQVQNAQLAAADASLRAANEDLERRVAERTATLRASQAALAEANASLEVRVAERSQELDRIFRLSNDVLAVVDFAANVRNISPAWARITGWPETEALDHPLERFLHPDDQSTIRPVLRRLRAGEKLVSFECRARRADGGWSWLAWRAVPLPEAQLIYAIGRDVTQDKAREEQLRQSQKMEIVGQLTGGIAHDFNNLLTIIMGSLEMLQRDPRAEPKYLRRVEAAMGGARRATALTHRLLAFSRRQPLAPRPLDANGLVAGMSDMLHRTLGETIAVEQIAAPALWPVMADANQLENAILNLAVNARDAMPNGGRITIGTANAALDERHVAAHAEAEAGDYVCISVADTGTGMSEAVKAKVFEPFFTTKPQGQGTGLGLAQVYGFITQSGGHVTIESEAGNGTTVKLYLPRLMRDFEEPDASEEPPPAPRHAVGETILLVEDEEGVRAFSAEVLEDLGYRVLRAENAAEAMRIFDATAKIDMLFTDVVLTGGTNGRQLADAIVAQRPGMIVLFTTGYTRNAIVHGGRLDEGVNFIGKPFTAAELAAKVGQLFERAAKLDAAKAG